MVELKRASSMLGRVLSLHPQPTKHILSQPLSFFQQQGSYRMVEFVTDTVSFATESKTKHVSGFKKNKVLLFSSGCLDLTNLLSRLLE